MDDEPERWRGYDDETRQALRHFRATGMAHRLDPPPPPDEFSDEWTPEAEMDKGADPDIRELRRFFRRYRDYRG